MAHYHKHIARYNGATTSSSLTVKKTLLHHYNWLSGYGSEPWAHGNEPCIYGNEPCAYANVYAFTYANEISLQVTMRDLPLMQAVRTSPYWPYTPSKLQTRLGVGSLRSCMTIFVNYIQFILAYPINDCPASSFQKLHRATRYSKHFQKSYVSSASFAAIRVIQGRPSSLRSFHTSSGKKLQTINIGL